MISETSLSPHDIEVEQAVLGALLLGGSHDEQVDIISTDDFYMHRHKAIYDVISALHARNGSIDYLIVQDELTARQHELAALVSVTVPISVVTEAGWLANDPEIEDWWNPVEVLEQVRIPVLAIFGDRDSNGDPIQGAYAWRKALEQAGNRNFRVELYPGINHFMVASESRCLSEHEEKFNQVLQEQGYGPIEETFALVQQEPGQHTPLSAWPYAPEYLELIEAWLTGLQP